MLDRESLFALVVAHETKAVIEIRVESRQVILAAFLLGPE